MADETSTLLVKPVEEELSPIVLSLGKKKKRAIKDFKRGRGRLMDEVEQTLEEVRAGLGASAMGKELVPVVMIYRQKQKKRKGRGFGRLW